MSFQDAPSTLWNVQVTRASVHTGSLLLVVAGMPVIPGATPTLLLFVGSLVSHDSWEIQRHFAVSLKISGVKWGFFQPSANQHPSF